MPNPFSQKELEALDLQWRSNEIEKIDAERDYHDGLLNQDQYKIAAAAQRYANAQVGNENLERVYQSRMAAANTPRELSQGEKDLREVWGQIKTGDPKQDAVLAERWKYAANQVNLGLNPLNNSKLSDGKQ
jgi:hypothetical protein